MSDTKMLYGYNFAAPLNIQNMNKKAKLELRISVKLKS